MKLMVITYPHPHLRVKCAPIEEITNEIRELAAHMLETMHIGNGIGLAAPQIDRTIRLFVMQVPLPKGEDSWDPGVERVFINPKILSLSKETATQAEGCLSLPGLYGEISRPVKIEVEALDLNNERFQLTLVDLEARCFLHENDHINGKLFIDRLSLKKRKELEGALRNLKQRG